MMMIAVRKYVNGDGDCLTFLMVMMIGEENERPGRVNRLTKTIK